MNLYLLEGTSIRTVMVTDTVSTFSNHDLKESLILGRHDICATETRTSYLNTLVPLHPLSRMHSYVGALAGSLVLSKQAGEAGPPEFPCIQITPKGQPSLYNLL